jgi:hypothetical protein
MLEFLGFTRFVVLVGAAYLAYRYARLLVAGHDPNDLPIPDPAAAGALGVTFFAGAAATALPGSGGSGTRLYGLALLLMSGAGMLVYTFVD